MPLATLTTKGQITIPKDVREALKLQTGDKVEIIVTKKREAVIRPVSRKVDEIFCKLRKPGRSVLTTEKMDAIISKRMKEKLT